jgi:hypothetical protein
LNHKEFEDSELLIEQYSILIRAKSDSEFRRLLLTEAVNELLTGDIEAGKAILRDYIAI